MELILQRVSRQAKGLEDLSPRRHGDAAAGEAVQRGTRYLAADYQQNLNRFHPYETFWFLAVLNGLGILPLLSRMWNMRK